MRYYRHRDVVLDALNDELEVARFTNVTVKDGYVSGALALHAHARVYVCCYMSTARVRAASSFCHIAA